MNRGISRITTLNRKSSLSLQLALLFESQVSVESRQAFSATQSSIWRPPSCSETGLGFERERTNVAGEPNKPYDAGAQSEQSIPISSRAVVQIHPFSSHAAEATRDPLEASRAQTLKQQELGKAERTQTKILPRRSAVRRLRRQGIVVRAAETQIKGASPKVESEVGLERL